MKLFPDLEKIILYLLTLEKPLNGGTGIIPNSVHLPYKNLTELIRPGGVLEALAKRSGQQLSMCLRREISHGS